MHATEDVNPRQLAAVPGANLDDDRAAAGVEDDVGTGIALPNGCHEAALRDCELESLHTRCFGIPPGKLKP